MENLVLPPLETELIKRPLPEENLGYYHSKIYKHTLKQDLIIDLSAVCLSENDGDGKPGLGSLI